MATLVRLHRRKISKSALTVLTPAQYEVLIPLLVVMRLSVVFARNRHFESVPIDQLAWNKNNIEMKIDADWLSNHPLINADLKDEVNRLVAIDINLVLSPM